MPSRLLRLPPPCLDYWFWGGKKPWAKFPSLTLSWFQIQHPLCCCSAGRELRVRTVAPFLKVDWLYDFSWICIDQYTLFFLAPPVKNGSPVAGGMKGLSLGAWRTAEQLPGYYSRSMIRLDIRQLPYSHMIRASSQIQQDGALLSLLLLLSMCKAPWMYVARYREHKTGIL